MGPPTDESDPRVSYTTKELLYDIRRQLDAIQTALIGKADFSVVVNIESRIDRQDQRLHALEQSDAIYKAQSRDRKYLFGALFTLISVLIAVAGLLLSTN